jgi:hypothetical protein
MININFGAVGDTNFNSDFKESNSEKWTNGGKSFNLKNGALRRFVLQKVLEKFALLLLFG